MTRGIVVGSVVWAVVLLSAVSLTLSAASSWSGRLETSLFLDVDETDVLLGHGRWPSELEMATEFHVDGWTFANVTRFCLDQGLDVVKFAAAGTLGAFDVVSSMTFYELAGLFTAVAAVRTSIGGIEIWSGATLSGVDPTYGVGFILGARGFAGDVEFYSDLAFNMHPLNSLPIIMEGFDEVWQRLMLCDLLGPGSGTCDLTFSYVNVYAKVPLSCFDIEMWTSFWWPTGFDSFRLWVSDIDLGLGGLTLAPMQVYYAIDKKWVFLNSGLRLADVVCITPYFSLGQSMPQVVGSLHEIDGLSVDALELICTVGDVTFIASELLVETMGGLFLGGRHVLGDDGRIHTIDFMGGVGTFTDCFNIVDANEAIGIEVNRGSCCDAALKLGIYVFFDTDLPGTSFSDWSEARVTIEYGAGSHLAVSGSLEVDHEQVISLGIRFEFLWGDLLIFGPDWDGACCRFFGIL